MMPRGKTKKSAKSRLLDDVSINPENTASCVIVKRMASTSLSSGCRKKREEDDEWGVTSSRTNNSSPWHSKKRVCFLGIIDCNLIIT